MTSSNHSRPRIAIISFPMVSSIIIDVFNNQLANIVASISQVTYLVGGRVSTQSKQSESVRIIDLEIGLHPKNDSNSTIAHKLRQAIRILAIQIKMAMWILETSRETDVIIFYVGGPNLLIPIIVSKMIGKRNYLFALGSVSDNLSKTNERGTLTRSGLRLLECASFCIADEIVVETGILINRLGLQRFKHKTTSFGSRYVDLDVFKPIVPWSERERLIGFVGRLDKGKGILNLAKAMSMLGQGCNEYGLVVVGDGSEREEVSRILRDTSPHVVSEVTGWTDHNSIAQVLNRIRLLVLPSYSEGLPTIVLEAMACGTPVLTTNVGGIPDVVRDGITGFLMEDNDPASIAMNIARALESKHISLIAENSRRLVQEAFSYEAAVRRFSRISK